MVRNTKQMFLQTHRAQIVFLFLYTANPKEGFKDIHSCHSRKTSTMYHIEDQNGKSLELNVL